jgi:hypothetical protein
MLMGQEEVYKLSSQATTNAARGKVHNALRDFEAALTAAARPFPAGVIREDDADSVFHPSSSVVAWLHMQAHSAALSGALSSPNPKIEDLSLDARSVVLFVAKFGLNVADLFVL